ncbi:hypothetical protein BDZ45DRAFT_743314 [Acephala macrosclerotiorum]|nr:hypothetical protein BDZ45DRAFT_743314 [Acephala macrosclerotiorum]
MNNNNRDMKIDGRKHKRFHNESESEEDMLSSRRRSNRSTGKRTASGNVSQAYKKSRIGSLPPKALIVPQHNGVPLTEASAPVGDNPSSHHDPDHPVRPAFNTRWDLPTFPHDNRSSTPAPITYKHALEEYLSVLDVHHPKVLHALENEGINLEALFRGNEFTGGAMLTVGDKLHVIVTHCITKEVEVSRLCIDGEIQKLMGFQRRPFPAAQIQHQPAGRVTDQSFLISMPPGEHATASTRFPNIQFPNANRPGSVRASKAMWEAAFSVLPPHIRLSARQGPRKDREQWDTVISFCDREELGCLNDIRLALQFCMNEYDFRTPLTFVGGRDKKVAEGVSTAAKTGFYMSRNNGLYLKVRIEKVAELNQDLLIDLGPKLNDVLAAQACLGYAIIMVDISVFIKDGLPVPSNSRFEEVLAKGPEAFPTAFTEKLAGSCGWTNAPKALEEEDASWTEEEKRKVDAFHSENIGGKIRHYPIPPTRSRRPSNIVATQYRKFQNDWIVDKTVHGEDVGRQTVFEASFGQAQLRERTRDLPARERPNLHDENPFLGGRRYGQIINGYEDAGRGSPPTDRGYRIPIGNLYLQKDLEADSNPPAEPGIRLPWGSSNEDTHH